MRTLKGSQIEFLPLSIGTVKDVVRSTGNMVCDGCKVSINGMGYRCLNCPDFGHCHRCVNKNISSHHATH